MVHIDHIADNFSILFCVFTCMSYSQSVTLNLQYIHLLLIISADQNLENTGHKIIEIVNNEKEKAKMCLSYAIRS